MPWTPRKKTSPRRRWSATRRSSLARTVARKAPRRYNWVEVLDSTCGLAILNPRACATNAEVDYTGPRQMNCITGAFEGASPAEPVAITIIPPNEPGGPYDLDNITVAKLEGYIQLMPYLVASDTLVDFLETLAAPAVPSVLANIIANTGWLFRAGLKKDDWRVDPAFGSQSIPRDPYIAEQWIDGRFSRRWERSSMPGEHGNSMVSSLTTGSALGVCANVTGTITGGGGGLAINTLTSGSGVINTQVSDVDGIIETDCQIMTIGTAAQTHTYVGSDAIKPWKLNLTSRQRYTLKEIEGLTLWMNYSTFAPILNPCIGPLGALPVEDRLMGVGFIMRSNLRALIET